MKDELISKVMDEVMRRKWAWKTCARRSGCG